MVILGWKDWKALKLPVVNGDDDHDDDDDDDDDDDNEEELFCGMGNRRNFFRLNPCPGHCQRFSPSQISDTPRTGLNLRITWVQNFMNEFFWSILWFRSIVLVYKGYTVQNNMSIKIELYSNDSHKTTGARLNGHSLCNQLLSFSQTFLISA